MDYTVNTFGEALYQILRKKNVSVDNLCLRLNLKSKTTVSRILKDESSFEKAEEFCKSLIQVNPLNLLEFERKRLLEALEVNRIGKDEYIANKELIYFVTQKNSVSEIVCSGVFGHMPLHIRNISDLFDTYNQYEHIRVGAVNCITDGVAQALARYLSRYDNATVEQYIPYEQSKAKNARQFVSVLSLLSFKKYNCYQAFFSGSSEFEILNRFNNMLVVMKSLPDNKRFVDIISLKSNNEFSVLYNQTDSFVFDFYTEIFDDMRRQHNPLKNPSQSKGLMETVIDLSTQFLNQERSFEQILIKPQFCFNSIAPDYISKLWVEDNVTAEKLGELLELQKQRFDNYTKRSKKHIGIYTKQGILKFLETGQLSDHSPLLRAFTQNEAQAVIKTIIELTENSPMNEIYLLKNEINYNQYQYLLYGKHILYFSNGNTDYRQANFNNIINSSDLVTAFHDFIKNELIPNHCYSFKDSMDFIKSVVNSNN